MDNQKQKAGAGPLSKEREIFTGAEENGAYRRFFLFLAVYGLLSGILAALWKNYIYQEKFLTGDNLRDIYGNAWLVWGCKTVLFIPVLLLLPVFYKKVKGNGQGSGVRLFEVIGFFLVLGNLVLPGAATAIWADGEMAELSAISVPALCMLTGGILAADRRLKWGAYVYMAVPVLLLSIIGIITNIYDRFAAASELSYHFALAAGYTKSFFYILYPAAGYLLAARAMKRCGNSLRRA